MALRTRNTLCLGMGWTTESETNLKMVKLGEDREGNTVPCPASPGSWGSQQSIETLARAARTPQLSPLSPGLAPFCLGTHILCRMGFGGY